jgi:hypothetical protein
LSSFERVAFSRLSVFAGGCTLEAAEAIIADAELEADQVLELLSGLVDKSLVVVDRTHATTRYGMSETLRQYAEERLVASGDAEAIRALHARWYAEFARAAGRGLNSTDELPWFERLQGEVENLQVAVAWAVAAEETELAMRLGGSFPRQASARPLLGTGYLAEQALGVPGADHHPLRARVMAEAGWAALTRGDPDTGVRLLHQSIEAQRSGGARYAAAAYAYLSSFWREGTETYEIAKEGLEAAEAAGDVLGVIGCRITLSAQAMVIGRDDEALDHARRALSDARQLGQPTLEAAALYVSGLALSNADPARAITILRQSVDLLEPLGIEDPRSAALSLIAGLEARHGDARRALEALRAQIAIRARSWSGSDLYLAMQVFNRVGRPDLVARCYGITRRVHVFLAPLYRKYTEYLVEQARATLGDAAFDQLASEGGSSAPEQFREELQREIDDLLAAT